MKRARRIIRNVARIVETREGEDEQSVAIEVLLTCGHRRTITSKRATTLRNATCFACMRGGAA